MALIPQVLRPRNGITVKETPQLFANPHLFPQHQSPRTFGMFFGGGKVAGISAAIASSRIFLLCPRLTSRVRSVLPSFPLAPSRFFMMNRKIRTPKRGFATAIGTPRYLRTSARAAGETVRKDERDHSHVQALHECPQRLDREYGGGRNLSACTGARLMGPAKEPPRGGSRVMAGDAW